MLPASLFCALFPAFVLAQDLVVPDWWKNTSSGITQDDRIQLFNTAYQTTDSQATEVIRKSFLGGLTLWQRARALSALARVDYSLKQENNSAIVTRAVAVQNLTDPSSSALWSINVPVTWGIAGVDAYRAYQDDAMLQFAKNIWAEQSQFQLTTEQAKQGSHPNKTRLFQSQCNGTSVAGGVFTLNSPTEVHLGSFTTSLFISLSALLAETQSQIGQDPSPYREAAIAGAQFLSGHLIDANGLPLDKLDIAISGSCQPSVPNNPAIAGVIIEGLSALADLTGDSEWRVMMERVLLFATTTSRWIADGGIVSHYETSSDREGPVFKGFLVRGLWEPWYRSQNASLRNYITAFINVQFNALLENATSRVDAHIYGTSWLGPPPNSFNITGALVALELQGVAALTVDDTSNPPNSPKPTTKPKSDNTGRIVGIALGVTLPILLFIIVGGLLLRQFRNHRHSPKELRAEVTPYGFAPPRNRESNGELEALVSYRKGLRTPAGDSQVRIAGPSNISSQSSGEAGRNGDQSQRDWDAVSTPELLRAIDALNARVTAAPAPQGENPPDYEEPGPVGDERAGPVQ